VKKEADEYKCKIIISIWTPEQKKKKKHFILSVKYMLDNCVGKTNQLKK
jgi:hypothetical protein